MKIIKDLFYDFILKISQIYWRTSKETIGCFTASPWGKRVLVLCVYVLDYRDVKGFCLFLCITTNYNTDGITTYFYATANGYTCKQANKKIQRNETRRGHSPELLFSALGSSASSSNITSYGIASIATLSLA